MDNQVEKSDGKFAPDFRKATGSGGETRAAEFLAGRGYSILERNFRTRGGEIDIIAREKNTLVFVEVKTLPNGDALTLAHVLDKRKRRKIIQTAKRFMAARSRLCENLFARFDVIAIDLPGFPEIHHIEGAFTE